MTLRCAFVFFEKCNFSGAPDITLAPDHYCNNTARDSVTARRRLGKLVECYTERY